jgi:hypothetical protein
MPSGRKLLTLGRALDSPREEHEERELQDRSAWASASNPIRFSG